MMAAAAVDEVIPFLQLLADKLPTTGVEKLTLLHFLYRTNFYKGAWLVFNIK